MTDPTNGETTAEKRPCILCGHDLAALYDDPDATSMTCPKCGTFYGVFRATVTYTAAEIDDCQPTPKVVRMGIHEFVKRNGGLP